MITLIEREKKKNLNKFKEWLIYLKSKKKKEKSKQGVNINVKLKESYYHFEWPFNQSKIKLNKYY